MVRVAVIFVIGSMGVAAGLGGNPIGVIIATVIIAALTVEAAICE